MISSSHAVRTVALTALAMLAFASNSLLCRQALGAGLIDAASFTTVRVISGALILGLILLVREKTIALNAGDWRSAVALLVYMIFFSFAYVSLATGTGALILFGAVQLTMFTIALRAGEHFSPASWAGLVLALSGLVYLVSPGVTAPDLGGAVLMAVAGIAWGFFSLLGRKAGKPLQATATSLFFCIPGVLIVSLMFSSAFHATVPGVMLAVASGAVASGVGYLIWYSVLPDLTATRAATVQLMVPAIAAIAAAILLDEPLSLRLVIASAVTLGGVAIVIVQRSAKVPPPGPVN